MNMPANIATPFADYVESRDPSDDFKVFPCIPNGKTPATPHGYKDATANPDQLREWAEENPAYNVAHSPEDSGHFVLDVDPKNGSEESLAALVATHGPLPETYTVQTPRVGRHYWFTGSAPSSAGKLGPGLDIRGVGGYVLLEGSRTEHGEYIEIIGGPAAPAPAWLVEKVNAPAHERKAAPANVELDLSHNVERARAFLKAREPAIEGQSGDTWTYQTAAAVMDLGCSPETTLALMQEDWNPRCQPPWEPDELENKVRNAGEYRQNEPGCHALPPASEIFAGYVAGAAKAAETTPRDRRIIVLRDEAAQDRREPPDYLIENFLPKIGTAAIFAPFNSYKSFTAADAELSVASGENCFGGLRVLRSGPAIYLAGEGLAGFESLRRPAWRIARGIASDRVLPIYAVDGLPLVRSAEDVQRYIDAIGGQKIGPALVVIDPVARAMAGLNENDAGDAGRYIELVDTFAKTFQCCVLSIFHEGKDPNQGVRGSSAFPGGFDSVWKQDADTERLVAKLTSVKQKDGADPEPIHLQGRQILVPAAGKSSLVFDVIRADEFKSINRKNSAFQRPDIGAALISLNAVRGNTVPTHVLATELAGPDADYATIEAKAKHLRRGAHDRFRGYVAHLGIGRGDATLWTMHDIKNGEGV